TPCEDLNHARRRIGAVEYARRPSYYFNAVDVVGREMTEVEKTAGRVDGHSIDKNLGVPTLAATQEERSHCAVRSALNEGCAGDFTKRVGNSHDSARAQIIAGKNCHRL